MNESRTPPTLNLEASILSGPPLWRHCPRGDPRPPRHYCTLPLVVVVVLVVIFCLLYNAQLLVGGDFCPERLLMMKRLITHDSP